MRITHNMMFSNMTSNMNTILGNYMESGIQMSSQKRVNRPSDDPTSTVRIFDYRASIVANDTFINNSKEADSWLKSTDGALQQAQGILTRITELAEQASTGTITPENRMQISFELEQLFDQLMNIANTEYNGTHIFSGHKTDIPAYQRGLGIMTETAEFKGANAVVNGSVPQTTMVRFPQDGQIGGNANLTYEYSKDGGKTWVTKTLNAGDTTLDLDGATIDYPDAKKNPIQVHAYDANQLTSPTNGSMLYVRRSAYYQGDDNDNPPEVDIFGASIGKAEAQGNFKTDVQIKFPKDVDLTKDGTVEFLYSTDNGLTWQTGKATTTQGKNSLRVVVPGGYIDVEAAANGKINAGDQFVVRPNRAQETGFEIAPGDFVEITNDGKDIFGGMYKGKGDKYAKVVEDPNIFETISNLIAYAQTNNQDGCGQSLEDMRKMSEHLLTSLARVGGKSNRVTVNTSVMENHRDNQTTRMSNIEDANLTDLLNKISRQQLTYQAVLQSSSMIMRMNLLNFI